MPPIEYRADPVKTEAEIIARAKAARERLWRGPPHASAPARLAPVQLPRPHVVPASPPVPVAGAPAPEQTIAPLSGSGTSEISTKTSIPIRRIIEAVCRHYSLAPEELTSKSIKPRVVIPRAVGYYLAAEFTSLSSLEIGRAFGRDHSTVLIGRERAKERLRDPQSSTARAIEQITAELRTKYPNAVCHPRLSRMERIANPLYPKGGTPFTPEDLEILRGWSGNEKTPLRIAAELNSIAQQLGRSYEAVRIKAKVMGRLVVEKRIRRPKSLHPVLKRPRWTTAEIEELRHSLEMGENGASIGRKLGKSRDAVWRAMRRFGLSRRGKEAA